MIRYHPNSITKTTHKKNMIKSIDKIIIQYYNEITLKTLALSYDKKYHKKLLTKK